MTLPPIVARAKAAAQALALEKSCRDVDGMLLHVLAGRRGLERVAEIGTGTGVGTAWLASALPPGIPLFTAELDERLAGAAAQLFANDPDVDVLHGDWRDVLPAHAPFDLIFVDAGSAKDDPGAVLALAAPVRPSCSTSSRPTGNGPTRAARAGSHTRDWWPWRSARDRPRRRSSPSSAAEGLARRGIVGR